MNWFKHTNKNKKSEDESTKNIEEKTNIENSDSISKKCELVEQEYNDTVRDLMISKRELQNTMRDVQKSNSVYADLVSKIKSTRAEILVINDELKEKNEEKERTMKEYEKLSLVIHEINNSKKELVETKAEIEKYHKELESIKINANNSPELNNLKQEKKELENEIVEKERR